MSAESIAEGQLLPIREDLITGIDVGGTKINVIDSDGPDIHRFETSSFPNLETVLETYFNQVGARPSYLVIGMAGAREDDSGEVALTNVEEWPSFKPEEASAVYGIPIETVNDMEATMAGILTLQEAELVEIKAGTPTKKGTKLVITLSTGLGAASARWDRVHERYVISPGEGGHMGFHPKDEVELGFAAFLHKQHPHASMELALAGGRGVDSIFDYFYDKDLLALRLVRSVNRARKAGNPTGSVLLAYATQGMGNDRFAAEQVLKRMGAMFGTAVQNLTLGSMATGGVYLTGSVAEALAEYFASKTDFSKRFVSHGDKHTRILERIPIKLVTNSHVAVVGAMALAKERASVLAAGRQSEPVER